VAPSKQASRLRRLPVRQPFRLYAEAIDFARKRHAFKQNRRPKAPAVNFEENRSRQELAFNTVTARRFCDQHEMSLQTATGRSLP
jgi:hypothetical protein